MRHNEVCIFIRFAQELAQRAFFTQGACARLLQGSAGVSSEGSGV